MEDYIKNKEKVKPKRKYTKKSKGTLALKKSTSLFNTIDGMNDSAEDDDMSDNAPDESEIPTTLLHRIVPLKRKNEIK